MLSYAGAAERGAGEEERRRDEGTGRRKSLELLVVRQQEQELG
jgi:hypothetical protein